MNREILNENTTMPILFIKKKERSLECGWCTALTLTDNNRKQKIGNINMPSSICNKHLSWFMKQVQGK